MKVYEMQVKYKAVKSIKVDTITKPHEVLKYMAGAFDSAPMQEHFYIILLNNQNEPIARHLCTLGLVNQCPVHSREVFKMAIVESAASIILVHNHPSGSLKPSQEDINVTKQLLEASKIIDIPILDHCIIANDNITSIRGLYPGFFNLLFIKP